MSKVEKVMHEFKHGKLHSGSKQGPKVKSRSQAIAIGLSEARKAGEKVKPKAYGSGPFSQSEVKQGYKVCYTANQLHEMDKDRLHAVEDFVMARRRNGTTSDGMASRRSKKNLRTSESL